MLSRKQSVLMGIGGIAVVFIALSVWVWIVYPRPDTGEQVKVSTPVEETTVVRYDGFSFKPQEIKVRAGAKVFFVNESTEQRPMYVASDDHPTHENYQGFDTAAVNQKFPGLSESFSFVFDRKGEWGYHDHNFPAARGRIIVE